jgi:HEAT repeat protein
MFQARHDLDAMFRTRIRHALRECDPMGAFAACVDLEEGDGMTRSRAAQVLGEIEHPPRVALAALSKALSDESHWVRHSGVKALGRFGTDAFSATEAIRSLLSDPELRVREAATNALNQILTPEIARGP